MKLARTIHTPDNFGVSRDDLVTEARSWIGVKWVHQGRTRKVGVDCIGLTICIGMRLNIISDDMFRAMPIDYGRPAEPKNMYDQIVKYLDEVWPPQIGDWIWVGPPREMACHVGMIASDQSWIHSSYDHGKVDEHPLRAAHLMRAKKAFSYRGLSDG